MIFVINYSTVYSKRYGSSMLGWGKYGAYDATSVDDVLTARCIVGIDTITLRSISLLHYEVLHYYTTMLGPLLLRALLLLYTHSARSTNTTRHDSTGLDSTIASCGREARQPLADGPPPGR